MCVSACLSLLRAVCVCELIFSHKKGVPCGGKGFSSSRDSKALKTKNGGTRYDGEAHLYLYCSSPLQLQQTAASVATDCCNSCICAPVSIHLYIYRYDGEAHLYVCCSSLLQLQQTAATDCCNSCICVGEGVATCLGSGGGGIFLKMCVVQQLQHFFIFAPLFSPHAAMCAFMLLYRCRCLFFSR